MNTTITFWVMPNAGFESKQTIEREIAHFRRIYPRVSVNCEILSWSRAWFRIIDAIKQKRGPDVMQVGTTWIGTLGYLGAMQRLEDGRAVHAADYIPSFFSTCQCFGHLWALPWFCETRVLFYRKDHLKRAGLAADALDTWESLRHACAALKKLKRGGPLIGPIGFSAQKEQGILQDLAILLWSHGGNFLSEDGKHSSLDSPGAIEGMRGLIAMISCGCIARESLSQSVGEVAENFFLHDSFSFLLSSSWPLHTYLNPSFRRFIGQEKAGKFGVALVPAGPAGRFTFAGGSSLAMTSFSHHPEEALSFLGFMTSRESVNRYCRSINMLSCRNDTMVRLSDDPEIQNVFEQSIARYGRSYPSHPLWGSIEQIMVNGFAQSIRDYVSGESRTDFFENLKGISQEIDRFWRINV